MAEASRLSSEALKLRRDASATVIVNLVGGYRLVFASQRSAVSVGVNKIYSHREFEVMRTVIEQLPYLGS